MRRDLRFVLMEKRNPEAICSRHIRTYPKVKPQVPLRYALSKNIPTKGPLNCRSLGFARDDKGKGCAYLSSLYGGWTEPQVICNFHPLGWAKGPWLLRSG
jgi:hypothetical protein